MKFNQIATVGTRNLFRAIGAWLFFIFAGGSACVGVFALYQVAIAQAAPLVSGLITFGICLLFALVFFVIALTCFLGFEEED